MRGVYKSDYEYMKILTLGIKMPNGTHYFAYSSTQKLPNQDFLRREAGGGVDIPSGVIGVLIV